MTDATETSWQQSRSSLNHDWLKNHLLTELAAAQNLLEGRVTGEAYLSYLFKEIASDWDLRKGEVAALIHGFEVGMSPGLLLDTEPLVHADAKTAQHCRNVVHKLWLSRCGVPHLVNAALRALDEADEVCGRLKSFSSEDRMIRDRSRLATVFAEFSQHCRNLAKCLEAFPSKVMAV